MKSQTKKLLLDIWQAVAWRYWVESDEHAAVDLLDDEDRQGLQPRGMCPAVSSLKEALHLLDQYPWHPSYP